MAAVSVWKYEPEQVATIDIRYSPEINGDRTVEKLYPGDVFEVSEEMPTPAGVTFLRLADGRGWVFDHKPGFGTMCVRLEGAPQQAAAPAPAAQVTAHAVPSVPPAFPGPTPMLPAPTPAFPGTMPVPTAIAPAGVMGRDANLWVQRYGLPSLETRAVPDVDGPRTGQLLMPGDSFLVAEELMGPSGVRYLRLADGRGWAFDYKPGVGPMCVRQAHSAPQPAPLPIGGLAGLGVPPGAGGLLPSASFVAAPLPPPAPGAGGLHPSTSFVSGAAAPPLAPFGPALLQAPALGATPQAIGLGTATHSMAAPPTLTAMAPASPLPSVISQAPGSLAVPPGGRGLSPVTQYNVPPEAAPANPLDVSTGSLADRLQPRHLGTRVTVYR